MTERLRVMTMNVLHFVHAGGERRREVLREGIGAAGPDVVALQEIQRTEAVDDVHGLLGDGWHVAAHPRQAGDGVGAALAGRRPLEEIRTLDLRVTERTAGTPWCGAVLARVRAPAPLGPVWVLHHKPSRPYGWEHERELQAVAAARLVEETAEDGEHVVLLGDFDAVPESASIRFRTGHQSLGQFSVACCDAWESADPGQPGLTFSPADNTLTATGRTPWEAGRRIDYVMVRRDRKGLPTLRIAGCDRALVSEVGSVQFSDHYGVVADLAVP